MAASMLNGTTGSGNTLVPGQWLSMGGSATDILSDARPQYLLVYLSHTHKGPGCVLVYTREIFCGPWR